MAPWGPLGPPKTFFLQPEGPPWAPLGPLCGSRSQISASNPGVREQRSSQGCLFSTREWVLASNPGVRERRSSQGRLFPGQKWVLASNPGVRGPFIITSHVWPSGVSAKGPFGNFFHHHRPCVAIMCDCLAKYFSSSSDFLMYRLVPVTPRGPGAPPLWALGDLGALQTGGSARSHF